MISGFLLKRAPQGLIFIIFVAAFTLFTPRTRAADDGFYDIDQEEHVLKSTAEHGFEIIPPESEQKWALIKITPSPKISPVKSNIVQVGDKKWAAVIDGTISIVTPLKGKTEKTSWDYRWEMPVQRAGDGFVMQSLTGKHPFLPYTRPTIALCRIDEDKQDLSEFNPILPFPTEWQNFVAPAYDYYKSHGRMFEPDLVADNEGELKKLLQDENPLLAVSACRTLAGAQSALIGIDFIQGPLSNATGWRRGIFTYLLLTKLSNVAQWKQTDADILEQIGKIIDNATTTESTRPIALAAITANDSTAGGFTDPLGPQVKSLLRKSSSTILKRVFMKQKTLDADYRIATILGAAGFFRPQSKSNIGSGLPKQ